MYDFPRAGSPTMMITSFAPTSRSAIRPSGDTRDRVMPGILSVVAWGRIRGVTLPEFCRIGGLQDHCQLSSFNAVPRKRRNRQSSFRAGNVTHILGEPGAVDARLRFDGLSTVTEPSLELVGVFPSPKSSRTFRRARAREPPVATCGGKSKSCVDGTWDNGRSSLWDRVGDAAPSVVDCVVFVCVRTGSWLLMAAFASVECFRPKSGRRKSDDSVSRCAFDQGW